MGYEAIYASKRDDGHGDGICVAWRPTRFNLLATKTLSLAPTMTHLAGAVPNLAIFVVLEDRRTGGKVVFGTTHLYWHWDYDHLRAIQAQFLFEHLAKWCHELHLHDHETIFVGGNFQYKCQSCI